MNNYNVPESAIKALGEHTSSDDGPSAKQLEQMADFIQEKLFTEVGALSKNAVRVMNAFEERIMDAMDQTTGADEPVCAHLGRLSLTDQEDCVTRLTNLSRWIVKEVANDLFYDLADEARSLGRIE